MAERERQFNIFVGAPGFGKSTFTSRIIQQSKDANAIIYKMALNIDDKAFSKFPECKDIAKYTGGKVKISDLTIKYPKLVRLVVDKYRNGHFVVDDAGLYERDIISDELNDLVMMRRHIGVDVSLIYHGLSFLPIQQFPFINNIILFHTTDNFTYKARRLPAGEQLQAAKDRIAAQVVKGNKYYHEVIKLS